MLARYMYGPFFIERERALEERFCGALCSSIERDRERERERWRDFSIFHVPYAIAEISLASGYMRKYG